MSASSIAAISSSPILSTRLKRVTFATDFSPISLAALPFAAAIARSFGSDLYLFHAVEPEFGYPATPGQVEVEAKHKMRDLARAALLADVKIGSEEVAQGGIELLKKSLATNEIDLVVVGTHGHSGVARVLLGSFAEQLIRSAPCAVLTVGPHIRKSAEQTFRPRQVLFATDASPDSFRALPDAILFAEKRCELTLLHVLPNGHEQTPEQDAFVSLMRDGLHSTIPLETIKRCNPEIVIKFGSAIDRILEVAAERQSELIVMGARSSKIKRMQKSQTSGVSYGVIVRAECPVLTVRGREF